jgi:hypothetical protein
MPLSGANRLYGILISKSANFIWKLHCEYGISSVIMQKHTTNEI